MGFWREFKDLYAQQADLISFGFNESSIGYRAFLRNDKNIIKDDHSLLGEVCGSLAGSLTDVITFFLVPTGLYVSQKIKKSNPQI